MKSLYIVVPCYNEEEALPECAPVLIEKLRALVAGEKISADSRVLFVDDGSADATWSILSRLFGENPDVCALRLSKNRKLRLNLKKNPLPLPRPRRRPKPLLKALRSKTSLQRS